MIYGIHIYDDCRSDRTVYEIFREGLPGDDLLTAICDGDDWWALTYRGKRVSKVAYLFISLSRGGLLQNEKIQSNSGQF
jgi:hypothetical protein